MGASLSPLRLEGSARLFCGCAGFLYIFPRAMDGCPIRLRSDQLQKHVCGKHSSGVGLKKICVWYLP